MSRHISLRPNEVVDDDKVDDGDDDDDEVGSQVGQLSMDTGRSTRRASSERTPLRPSSVCPSALH